MLARTAAVTALLTLLLLMLVPALTSATIVNVTKEFMVLEIPDSRQEGFEPHVLAGPSVDGEEWLYVDSPTGLGNADGQGGNLWISKDHGDSWDWYDKDMATGTGRSGDSYTAVNSDGVIYYTDLYLSTASVDWSLDGGETWIQNPFASFYPVVDRQWLMIGPDGSGGQLLYFSYNELATGLMMVKSRMLANGAIDWQPCNGGLPITSDVGSRDNYAVDQENGNIYHSNWQSDGIHVYISTDLGESFTDSTVESGTAHAAAQNTFMMIDVDTAGNVYLMWSSREHIMLAVSEDEGDTWDVRHVTDSPGTRVFPWIVAGDEGRIAMAWYETNDTGNPNNLDDSWWDFLVAISIDALEPDPLYEVVNLDPYAHYGSVRTSGLDGDDGNEPDRDLGDYIGIDVDMYGRAIVVWGHDGDDGVNSRQLPIMFARQEEGPYLFDNSLRANFTAVARGLRVEVDASASQEQSLTTIVNYTWDWGDGLEGEGVVARHDYSKGGRYTISLTVTDEDGYSSSTGLTITVKEKDDDGFPWEAVSIGAFVLIAAIGAVMLLRMAGRKPEGGEVVEVATVVEEEVPAGEPVAGPPEGAGEQPPPSDGGG
ncbi:MAG: PKD domain-containing protein [Thermoplasmata archaeon]|nr:PKD domain-containing protein [Thermoplasmata archaeon]